MGSGYVGILTVDLHLPVSNSLKDKRKELQRVKAGLAKRFHCAVAEVADHDLHRRARLTLAIVAREASDADRLLDEALRWLDGDPEFEVLGAARDLVAVDETASSTFGG